MATIDLEEVQGLSLDNCDKEPIHIPGQIQDFAVCLSTDAKLETIRHCSDNTLPVLGKTPQEVLGKNLPDIFSREIIHDLNNALSLSSSRLQRERATQCRFGDSDYEIWVHYSNQFPVIEIEKIPDVDSNPGEVIRKVRSLVTYIGRTDDIHISFSNAVDGLRSLSGFDRVLLYQFDKEGNGEIKAESKAPGIESFLGLRFPSWDIPKQARKLLMKVPLRVVANVKGKPVPLLCIDPNADPLDLSLAACRGQSPVHAEYLSNMGVISNMTLSIIVGGKLWGLFAFHHMSQHIIGPSLRGAAELFVQFYSLQMEQRQAGKRSLTRSMAKEFEDVILNRSGYADTAVAAVKSIAGPLCKFVEADGLSAVSNTEVLLHGITPSAETVREISRILLDDSKATVVETDCLLELGVEAGPSAGALAIQVGPVSKDALIFFRNEAIQSVTWAGAPEKQIVDGEDGPRLLPRGSFLAYVKEQKGKSLAWEENSFIAAEALREILNGAEYRRDERLRAIYVEELNHRVRNILALIRSLVRRTSESSTSLETYAKTLEQRISALGVAPDLAANRIADGLDIRTTFQTEAKPFVTSGTKQLFFTGQDYIVHSQVAPLFALISHELVTNSVKYGALSVSTGRVDIDLQKNEHGLVINWQESNGPKVREPKHKGFGHSLIETSIPYELGGECEIQFLDDGLKATFKLPVDIVDTSAKQRLPVEDVTVSQSADIPRRALIVEDSLMIALDMRDMLEAIGVREVEKCSTVASAKKLLTTFTPDIAVLDVSLKDEQSFEVADILQDLSIPFCFATGYGSKYESVAKYGQVTVLTKPVDLEVLRSAVNEMYRK